MYRVSRILGGDIRAASRLMNDIDDGISESREALKALYLKTGRAHIVGITGPPGSGKSTLIDKMVAIFRAEDKTVGIAAVDPTSPFSGGAILGDRIRMQRHAGDEGVFIRSVGTRGDLGGLSRSVRDIIHVMDAMGKDIILVETVGVGQDEVKIMNTAHVTIVVLIPGTGDEIQILKAGILEIADIFVINKSEREGADKLERDLRTLIGTKKQKADNWEPLILRTEAVTGKGVPELVSGIYRHRQFLDLHHPALEKRTRQSVASSLLDNLESEIISHITGKLKKEGRWDALVDDVIAHRTDPYTAVEAMLAITSTDYKESRERRSDQE